MFKGTVLILILTLVIGGVFLFRDSQSSVSLEPTIQTPINVELEQEVRIISPIPVLSATEPSSEQNVIPKAIIQKDEIPAPTNEEVAAKENSFSAAPWPISSQDLPSDDRIDELFNLDGQGAQLPIVETITYKSRVHWHKGSPAWISDYANHYNTSRHFIARSLNGKPDYFKQDIAEGKRFNVYKPSSNFEYYILVDLSRCKLWLYYIDKKNQEKVLLKDYDVGLGRFDENKISGLLTPSGKYTLGNRTAIYSSGIMGHHKGKKVEMIRMFGTRWIPFDKEIADTTEPAKGFGIHGVPWIKQGDKLVEDVSSINHYESDGCIRMAAKDIEEIYAIVITKPTTIELVDDFNQSKLHGKGE